MSSLEPLGLPLVDERVSRLPVAHLRLEPASSPASDVRRVRDDEVERPLDARRAGRCARELDVETVRSAFSRASASASAEGRSRRPARRDAPASARARSRRCRCRRRRRAARRRPRAARGSARRRSRSRAAARARARRSSASAGESPSRRARTRAARACRAAARARARPRAPPRSAAGRAACRARFAEGRARARGSARHRRAGSRRPAPRGSPSRRFRTSASVNFERAPLLVGRERFGVLVEVALRAPARAVIVELHAVVGDAVLGEVVGPDLLGARARADLRAAGRGLLGRLPLALGLVDSRRSTRIAFSGSAAASARPASRRRSRSADA